MNQIKCVDVQLFVDVFPLVGKERKISNTENAGA